MNMKEIIPLIVVIIPIICISLLMIAAFSMLMVKEIIKEYKR